MTLRELVALAHLRLGVVVNAGGLDRPIRWVYVTELSDPTVYLRGGELVLTNGMWRAGGASSESFVEALCRSGVCGLGYGLEPITPRTPQDLIDACRARRLPLVEIAHPVSFGAVSQALADHSAERRQAALLSALRTDRALVEAIASGSGVDGVLDVLGAEPALRPSLHEQSGRVLTSAGSSPSPVEVAAVAATIAKAPAYPLSIPLDDGERGALFAVPRDRPTAFLLCRKGLPQLSVDERSVIDQAVTFLGLVFAQRRAMQTLEMRLASDLIDQLQSGAAPPADPRARLESFGIDPEATLAAVAVHTDGEASLIGEMAAAHFASYAAPAVLAEAEGELLVITAWSQSDDALLGAMREFAIRAGAALAGSKVSVGIGSLQHGASTLRRSLVEARHACVAARRGGAEPQVVTYRESASHRQLFALHDADVRSAFRATVLQPLVEYDAAHRGDLALTLRAFLRNAGQWKKTAGELHVHVNTLRHRLRRIEELTDRDMSNMDDRVDFYVALGDDDRAVAAS
jgi:DNA-binding PucR family transcriptional regulator